MIDFYWICDWLLSSFLFWLCKLGSDISGETGDIFDTDDTNSELEDGCIVDDG